MILDSPDRGEEQDNLRRQSDGASSTSRQDTSWYVLVKPKMISGLYSRNFIYRHHVEPRVNLCVPTEESFPFPLKYNDITRTTDTTSDVMSAKHTEDYWNVDGDRELSDAWTGFIRFIVSNEKPPGI